MPAASAADPIALLLAGRYLDRESGALLAAETRSLVIEERLDGSEAELVAGLGAGRKVAVLSDVDTSAVMGHRIERALGGRFDVQPIVLERDPHGDASLVQRIVAALDPATDLVIAVGSGTVNDLAKLVAHARGVPQAVFATAPSMNGYTSVSASLFDGGVKRSVRTATPVGVFFDLRVQAAAPPRMIRAGLGDSLCRSTAQVDWLLAHLLLDRPYREVPFALLADDERALFADPAALMHGDTAAMRHLVRTLVLSGFGMTLCGGSYPASQGEHLLAHFVAMTRPPDVVPALHGEEIGVCTLAMAELQGRFLDADEAPVLAPSTVTHDELRARYGPGPGEICWRELVPKLLDRARADAFNQRLADGWPAMRARMAAVSVDAARLRATLLAAAAPIAPSELGWPAPLFAAARRHAREIRDRYTFLDLAADAAA